MFFSSSAQFIVLRIFSNGLCTLCNLFLVFYHHLGSGFLHVCFEICRKLFRCLAFGGQRRRSFFARSSSAPLCRIWLLRLARDVIYCSSGASPLGARSSRAFALGARTIIREAMRVRLLVSALGARSFRAFRSRVRNGHARCVARCDAR